MKPSLCQLLQRRMLFALVALLSGSLVVLGQSGDMLSAELGGQYYASQYGGWSLTADGPVTAPGSATISIPTAAVTLPGGRSFVPLRVGTPLLVLDGTRQETIRPVDVHCATNSSNCTVTADFAEPHPERFEISSATGGLQEAINDAADARGGTVVITGEWNGGQSQIAAADGFSTVAVVDIRAGQRHWYEWNNAKYVDVANVSPSGLNVTTFEQVRFADQWCATPGTLDDTCIQNAIDSLSSSGGVVFVPSGLYLIQHQILLHTSQIHLVGAGIGTTILRASPGISGPPAYGMLTIGLTVTAGQYSAAPVNGIRIQDLTIDGQDLTNPLYIANVTSGTVRAVQAENSSGAVLTVANSTDFIVRDSVLSGGHGTFGDGLFFDGCTRPEAIGNTVTDVTRVGIVADNSGSGTNNDVVFADNIVSDVHDATGGEINAGLWMENTIGGRITGNLISNVDNGTGAGSSRGIAIGPYSGTSAAHFTLTSNTIQGASRGVVIWTNSSADVRLNGLLVESGTNQSGNQVSYQVGIEIDSARLVDITDATFGDTSISASDGGLVVISPQSDIDTVVVRNCSEGTIALTAASAADVNLLAFSGHSLQHLRLVGLDGWSIASRDLPVEESILSSTLSLSAGSFYGIGATGRLFAMASRLIATGQNAVAVPDTGPIYNFEGDVFESFSVTLRNSGTTSAKLRIDNSDFLSGASIDVAAAADITFDSCDFTNYAATGAVRGNELNYPLSLSFRNVDFADGANGAIPIQLTAFQPDAVILENVTTTASQVTTMQQTYGNLTTPPFHTGSLVIGSDAPMSAAPRMLWSAFIGDFSTAGIRASFTPDKAMIITRMQASAIAAPNGCTVNAVLRLQQGGNSQDLQIASATNDSGPISFHVSAGVAVTVSLFTPPTGCTVDPGNTNLSIEYLMQ